MDYNQTRNLLKNKSAERTFRLHNAKRKVSKWEKIPDEIRKISSDDGKEIERKEDSTISSNGELYQDWLVKFGFIGTSTPSHQRLQGGRLSHMGISAGLSVTLETSDAFGVVSHSPKPASNIPSVESITSSLVNDKCKEKHENPPE